MHANHEFSLKTRIGEESPAGARVADPDSLAGDSKVFSDRVLVAADDDNCPRSHMLLFAEDVGYPFMTTVSKRLDRMLQQPFSPAGFRQRHGRRQIDEPFRIYGEPVYHFEGRTLFQGLN